MIRNLLLFIYFIAVLQSSCFAQSLDYSGPNSFNITSPTHFGANVIPSIERTPTGMAFGDNGNKLYIIGAIGDQVIQYDLSTAYDISTRGLIQANFRTNVEENSPDDVTFNDVGTKMYILGGNGDDVTEYALSVAWDVSTATFTDTFDAETAIDTFLETTARGDQLTGMRFNNNGSKLYIVDRDSEEVFEFDLSTNYDVSTAGAVVSRLSVVGENNPRSITFNNNGTELYIIGNQGDDINVFPLSIAYDLSSSGVSSNFSLPSTPDNTPQALLLSNNGLTFYVAGSSDDEIKEYSLSSSFDFSSTISFVSTYTFPSIEGAPQGMIFNDDGTKLFVTGNQLDAVSELSLSIPYDLSTVEFVAGLYVNAEDNSPRGLAFNNTGTTLYVIGSQSDEINGYDLSVAYDLTSTITTTTGSPFTIVAQDNNPTDIFFNDDGTKLYVLGNQGNDLNQYSLSPAYDLTDAVLANLDIAFPLNNVSGLVIDSAPQGMAFNNDGTKLYIAGNTGNDINEISLSNAYDLSSGTITNTNTFSVLGEEATITDVVFNDSGSKFFICGSDGDDMNQYQLKGNLEENTSNNGTIDLVTPLTITLTGGTFADVDADNLLDIDTEFTIDNLPTGLTPVLTLSSGDTIATLTFSTNASEHLDANDVANLVFNFTDAAFTSSTAAEVVNAVGFTNILSVDFIDCPLDIVYDGVSWTGGSGPSGAPGNTDVASGIRVQGDVTLTANVSCNCLHVESGNTLSVATRQELEVSNALELVGDLRLLGSSQLKQNHSGVKNVPGNGSLYKDVQGTLTNVFQYGYWASPVSTNRQTYNIAGVLKDGTISLATTGEPFDISFSLGFDGDNATFPITISKRWLAKFVNSSNWTIFINESTELFHPGEGFAKKSTGAISGQNYTFKGIPNDGDYTHTIDAFINANSGPWSLLGNPYPSPINADTFIQENAVIAGSIVGTLYFYEAGNDSSHFETEYSGGYANRVSGMGTPAPELAMAGKTPGTNIGIGQGFFVKASATGGTITFNNDQRVFDVLNTNTEFFSKQQTSKKEANFPILRIGFEFNLGESLYHRQVAVGFRGLTKAYENGYEAEIRDYKPTDMGLKMEGEESSYAILGIQDFNTDIKIPLSVRADELRNVTFLIDENQIDTNVYLFDKLTNNYYNLSKEKAVIQLERGNYDYRFSIVFKNNKILSLKEKLLEKVLIFKKDKQIIVKDNQLNVNEANVYDMLGKKINLEINRNFQSEISININTLNSGIFIVKLDTSLGIIIKKIIID